MHLQKLVSNYCIFNNWANTQIINFLENIESKILYSPTISSFNTIDYTLQHILRTQKFWYTFICQQDTSTLNWSVRENEVNIIMNELAAISQKMKNTFISFSDNDLCNKLLLDTPWAKNNLCRYEYIIHVVNHSTFHRGQIITMARSLGVAENIPNTDYNNFNTIDS